METRADRWYRHPWKVFGALCLLGSFGLLVAFGAQVRHYMGLIRSGAEDPLKEERLRASISKVFAQNAGRTDASRVEAKKGYATYGNPQAKVRIVQFADFDCPYCRETAPRLRAFLEKHRDEVFFMLRDFPLVDIHPQAMDASYAAQCVLMQNVPSRYWKLHDRLYTTQGAHAPADLRLYAEQAGADMAEYDRCILRKLPQSLIEASLQDGQLAGVQGTPTFFFNGVKIQGAIDAKGFEAIFEEAKRRAN